MPRCEAEKAISVVSFIIGGEYYTEHHQYTCKWD